MAKRRDVNAKRVYEAGKPLYARARMTFSGVVVERGEQIPERTERKRKQLWNARKVTHIARVMTPPTIHLVEPSAGLLAVAPVDAATSTPLPPATSQGIARPSHARQKHGHPSRR